MKSLAEQLLKAGLVDDKKAKAVKKEKYVEQKHARKHKVETVDEARSAADLARQQKLERDRELNRQRQQEAEQRAIIAQVRQLIDCNKVERRQGDISYNFTHQGKVKTLHLTSAVRQQLVLGNLSIVTQDDRYELVPTGVASKIRERHADAVVLDNSTLQASSVSDETDPYAAFVVPDDLMW